MNQLKMPNHFDYIIITFEMKHIELKKASSYTKSD